MVDIVVKVTKVIITGRAYSHCCASKWGSDISLITPNAGDLRTNGLIGIGRVSISKSALANLPIHSNVVWVMAVLRNPSKGLRVIKSVSLHAHSDSVCCICTWVAPANHIERTFIIAHTVISSSQILLTRGFVRSRCICNASHSNIAISRIIASLCCSSPSAVPFHTSSREALRVVSAIPSSH